MIWPSNLKGEIDMKKTWIGLLAGAMMLAQVATVSAAPAQATQRLYFARGTDTLERRGTLRNGDMQRYVIRLGVNDNFIVTAASPRSDALLTIWGADGTVLISDMADATHWAGVTPKTQDYYIDVRAMDGKTTTYTLIVTARPIKSNPPHPGVQRIVFAPGAVSAVVSGRVVQGGNNAYVLKASRNQRMLINTTARAPGVVLTVYGADGTVLMSSMAGAPTFSGNLPSTQDYYITVTAGGAGAFNYSMRVTVEGPVR
jgi:hypothetical protein